MSATVRRHTRGQWGFSSSSSVRFCSSLPPPRFDSTRRLASSRFCRSYGPNLEILEMRGIRGCRFFCRHSLILPQFESRRLMSPCLEG
ncbi:hypothetical protein KP509_03G038400 [Ceratopteris richardii]|uniref:Uncharacterized protein n=1 Tax=Ceratopteris richardii TaxID=49495 RepID=A0A8T2UZ29_CERRI|nr:hypothetical protein KP509_03G038400 [Ceratopteris richardii]